MSERFSIERTAKPSADLVLLALLVLLVGVGFVAMFSSSYYHGQRISGDPGYFLKRHLFHAGIGLALAFVLARIPLSLVRKGIPALIILSFGLILLSFLPGIGREVNNARRWIYIPGFSSFQPSEFAKLALVAYLAHIFSKKEEKVHDIVNGLLPPLLVVGSFVALIYLQNDFSTAVFILLISLCMFFVGGVKIRYFLFLTTAALPLSVLLLLTKEHRVRRLISFLDPAGDPVGSGYQVIAARSALIRGGFWGNGLGKGTQKLGVLPEAHSDFVFASLGEEMGFIGVLFILALFVAFGVRGYMVAFTGEDRFAYYLGVGITTCIVTQALFNIAVISGLVPATGIPLPFFSAGGSSLVMTLTMCGLLVNLSRTNARREAI